MKNITVETTLREIVREAPASMELMNDLGIDYCCAGDDTVAVAAAKKNLDPESVVRLIEKSRGVPSEKYKEEANSVEQFQRLSISEMIAELVRTHHKEERMRLEELDRLINKILRVHYKSHAALLIPLHTAYSQLQMELLQHFVKEEERIFPFMEANPHPNEEAVRYVEELENEHDVAGDLIHQIQDLTNQFSVPDGVCPTFERTFRLLRELIEDIFVHIFKENSILFPKYRKQAIR